MNDLSLANAAVARVPRATAGCSSYWLATISCRIRGTKSWRWLYATMLRHSRASIEKHMQKMHAKNDAEI